MSLLFVNHEIGAEVIDLMSVFTGIFYSDDGNKFKIFSKYSEGRIREEKFRIDLYLWFDRDGKTYFRFVLDSPFKNQLCDIFGVDTNKLHA